MKLNTTIFLLVTLVISSTPVNATLIDRGGGLIFDDVLGITWLQDANYAMTSGTAPNFPDGKMYLSAAMQWASGLSYYDSVRNVTWNDWRLPEALPVNGSEYDIQPPAEYDGSTDWGYNISAPGSAYSGSTSNELAYMYYNNLRNKAPLGPNGNIQSDYGLQNVGPFISLAGVLDLQFYSGSLIPSEPNIGIIFTFYDGAQLPRLNSYSNMFAWAVRDGDVGAAPVPEPATIILLGTGLFGLVGVSRKKFER